MSNIGIPMWVFQLQPQNSEAREPTTVICLLILMVWLLESLMGGLVLERDLLLTCVLYTFFNKISLVGYSN